MEVGKETTTAAINWNYTIPNLLKRLDFLIASAKAKKLQSAIIKKLNSSFFIISNSSLSSASSIFGNSTGVSAASVRRPTFSLSSKSTMPSYQVFTSSKHNLTDYNGEFFDSYKIYSMPTAKEEYATSVLVNSSLGDSDLWFSVNETLNYTLAGSNITTQQDAAYSTLGMAITSMVLGIMILTTVIGNVFVIAAILLERNLQQVANFLIVSLAVADLMVACLVMPLGAVYEISQEWSLGPELCDMWTSSDVLCCTASILHLVVIALDRYWAVSNIAYVHTRNGKRVGTMLVFVWLTALLVSIAPLFGWKDPDYSVRVTEQKRCLVSQDISYQIFATMATFYVPLTVILILYWKIFQTARKRIHKRPGRNEMVQQIIKKSNSTNNKRAKKSSKSNGLPQQQTTAFTTEASGDQGASPDRSSNNCAISLSSHVSDSPKEEIVHISTIPKVEPAKKHKKESLENKRERKAAKTLAVITGAFVVCWLPFFVTALLMSICPNCWKSDLMISIFLWLGYFNSTLNPIIYTIFSPEFREAFKKIIFGRKHQRYRPGKVR